MPEPVDQAGLEDRVVPAHALALARGPALDRRVREDLADHGQALAGHLRRRARRRGRSVRLPRDADAADSSIRRPRKAR
jgi:hypothetical protein